MEIELNNSEKTEIRELGGSVYTEINKDKKKSTNKVNVYDLIKYVCYWKKILQNEINDMPRIAPNIDDQEYVVGYKQLEQIGQESFDRTTPLGLLKLQIFQFCTYNNNLISEDQLSTILNNVDTYETFIDKIEYKNPIYLSLGFICIKKDTQIPTTLYPINPIDSIVEEEEEEEGDIWEEGDEGDYDSDIDDEF
jgi:hypothetical protein